MATSSGCGDHGQVEQAIAERLSVCNVDYGPDTLTFRRGSSWDEAQPDLDTVLAGVTPHGGWVGTPHSRIVVSVKANEPDGTLDWLRRQRSEPPEGMSERPLRCWDGHLRLALMEQAGSISRLLPKRRLSCAKCSECCMHIEHTEHSAVSEAALAALTEPGLDALPKASMRWPDSVQAVLLVLRAACEKDNEHQHSLWRIICSTPARNGQKRQANRVDEAPAATVRRASPGVQI